MVGYADPDLAGLTHIDNVVFAIGGPADYDIHGGTVSGDDGRLNAVRPLKLIPGNFHPRSSSPFCCYLHRKGDWDGFRLTTDIGKSTRIHNVLSLRLPPTRPHHAEDPHLLFPR